MKSISIKNKKIDASTFTIMAGPCSIESKKQFESIVKFLKTQGISTIRGGIFKPRTNPKDFQGLREKAFPIVKEVKKTEDFLFITEITDVRQIENLMDITDIFQVGTRNMYNYDLLKELAHTNLPILLKRNFSASIKEWLFAAKYLAPNNQIILCERGIRTFETAYRYTSDINAVSYIRQNSHHPIFADPSHATGNSSLVSDISKSALAAGACGLLIEVHNEPDKALSDGAQALNFNQFSSLMTDLKNLSKALNKTIQ